MNHQIDSLSSVKQDSATLRRLQGEYLELVPHIRRRAAFRYRAIRCPGRHADMVAEAVASGWKLFLRMHQRGIKLTGWGRWFTYIAAQLPLQHRVAGINRQDVLDRLKRVSTATYADAFSTDRKGRMDIPEMIAFKLDWEAFRAGLAPKERRIIDALFQFGGPAAVARRLGIPARMVSRLRCKLAKRWAGLEAQN